MGRQGIQALLIGLLVSVSVVVFGDAGNSNVPVDESAATAPEESDETQPLYELIRGVSNYGYEMGKPGSENVVYWGTFFDELDEEPTEYRALLDSLSSGVRASYDGVWMVRRDAFKREQERREAEQERAEAEYAVFIEEHLRRLSGEAPVSEQAKGCQERLERELRDCDECSTDGVCEDGERITYGP